MSGRLKGWEMAIGDVADISSGFGFPKDRQGKNVGDYPFAKVSDISRAVAETGGRLSIAANYADIADLKALGAKPVPAGSTVFSKIGEALRLNRRAIAEVDVILDNNCMALSPAMDRVIPRYLFWFMHTVDLSPYAVATSVPSVRRGDVAKLSLFIPDLTEQHEIVAKLDSLTDRTARAREELGRIPKLIQKYREAILVAAFKGRLTREWRSSFPTDETAERLVTRTTEPEKSRGGREATERVIHGIAGLSVNHPGSDVPPGWAWVRLTRIARQTGHTPSRSRPDYWDGGVPWVGIKDANIHHGRVIDQTLQTISDLGLENSSARLLPTGTVCLSRTASVGYVTIMPNHGNKPRFRDVDLHGSPFTKVLDVCIDGRG